MKGNREEGGAIVSAAFKHSFAKTTLQFAAFVVSIAIFVTSFSRSEQSEARNGNAPLSLSSL
jgi:hypothetical protein